MRYSLEALVLTVVTVRARLTVRNIASALEEEYGNGEYVNPEGPLNIMRGHSCVNNGMIAKQRMYAAPMRLSYSCTGGASGGDCAYARNACEDSVRELTADSDAMAYLSEHYAVLKSMFTVENDVVVVDRSPVAPFYSLFKSARERCAELFAALLVLAGGADIRLGSDGSEQAVLLFFNGAAAPLHAHVLELGPVDDATLAAVEFFAKYGGNNAKHIFGYGLHYTDSPGFLIQAYICELIKEKDDVIRIFAAAKRIVAELSAGNPRARQELRFFTTDRDGDYVGTYPARYSALAAAETAFNGAQHAVLTHWRNLSRCSYSGRDDPKDIVAALLKVCCCLCSNPVADRSNVACLDNPAHELRCAFGKFVHQVFLASVFFNTTGSFPKGRWDSVGKVYEGFLAVARVKASASETITACCGENVSAGLATDPKNFLVVLAWVLGEPEEELRCLRQLLDDALGAAGSASHRRQISDRVTELLKRFYDAPLDARFDVFTAPDGARRGLLWLTLRPCHGGTTCDYVLKLVFEPERVRIVYVAQQAVVDGEPRRELVSALKELCLPSRPALSTLAHEELDRRNDYPLRALIRRSAMQALYPAAHRAVSDAYIAEVSAVKSPLARHIAISHWMAHQPMQTLGEAAIAAVQLLPALEDSLDRVRNGDNSAQRALTADSPVVAVLDNILGSTAAADTELRPFIVSGLHSCVKDRTDLFPSVFSAVGDSASTVQEHDGSAYDRFLDSLTAYDISEMLLRHAEQRARSKIEAAGGTRGPWDSDVCAALARCFKLRYENSTIRVLSEDAPAVDHYEQSVKILIRTANWAADSGHAPLCRDVCAAAARCFKPTYGTDISGLGSDTLDMRYYRYSICALMAAAANPAEYHSVLRSIFGSWDDTFGVFEVYVLLRMAFPRLPKLGPISPNLVAEIFPHGPEDVELEGLLRIFAVAALADRDYCGICDVFHGYRALLSPECACRLVRALKRRPSVYSFTSRKLSNRSAVPVDDVRTPVFYSAFDELLVECLENAFDVKTLLVRVRGLPRE
ncbi:hypothetical protein PAPHI01_0973 [Pancytospora philotis]|nr:hypothetical protein PAPHI01_0973 [Pancytospora philotis]